MIFAKALGLKNLNIENCRLSVVDQTGETDLFATFDSPTGKGSLLIENKIDASFQPRQPERYRERAAALVEQGEYFESFCVLIAPAKYAQMKAETFVHFDAILSYEELAQAICEESSQRSKYRAALLLKAVEQARNAYTLTPSADVSALWQRIYLMATTHFPDLKMEVPTEKGSQSKWVVFKGDLPPRITIDWKITKATVELSFWKGAQARFINFAKQRPFQRNSKLVELGGTLAIQTAVIAPPSDWTSIPDDQINDALAKANDLLAFFKSIDTQPTT